MEREKEPSGIKGTGRYERQLPVLGEEGQERLRKARVLVAGVGGLGTVVSAYLAGAGVGFIRLADQDRVEISNLHRQILFSQDDIGREKAAAAAERLLAMNPSIRVEGVCRTLVKETACDMTEDVDLIVDALDNYNARFLLNRIAFTRRIPLIHGAVRGFFGQATTLIPGRTACLRCLVAQAPPPEACPILGGTCGVIGAVQATEAVKVLTGVGEPLADRLFLWDGRTGEATIMHTERNPRCAVCGEKTDKPHPKRRSRP
jgi:molybdopterin/thiamine biosynthesis adenylyltransferase